MLACFFFFRQDEGVGGKGFCFDEWMFFYEGKGGEFGGWEDRELTECLGQTRREFFVSF